VKRKKKKKKKMKGKRRSYKKWLKIGRPRAKGVDGGSQVRE
jgi:hypothetical protein